MIKRYNHELNRFCYNCNYNCKVEADEDPSGEWVKYEDHAAEIKKLLPVVKFAARFSCDISLYGTLPTCSDQYPDQRDTHWCVGCMARDALLEADLDRVAQTNVDLLNRAEEAERQCESLRGQIKSLKGMIDEILSTDSSTGDRIFP